MDFEKYIDPLKSVMQNPRYHGEGDVYSHTMMVLDFLHGMQEYKDLSDEESKIVETACILHDIGKMECSRIENGDIVSRGHSLKGSSTARMILWNEGYNGNRMYFRETVCWLIANHGKPPHFWEELEKNESNAVQWLQRLALSNSEGCSSLKLLWILCMADWNGRLCESKDYGLVSLEALRQYAIENQCFDTYPFCSDDYSRFAFLNGKTYSPSEKLYDSTWGEVTIMSGLPGTGKSTWLEMNREGIPVVSLDDIRQKNKILPTENQDAVVREGFELAKEYLRKHIQFAWDATCLNNDTRKKICKLCIDYGAFANIVYLETDDESRSKRNHGRKHTVPDDAIEKMKSKVVPPDYTEAHKANWIVIS